MNTALTIAGSDSSGGAGIQADIKTMTANRVYAMSAITALTAQNTTGVTDIMEVTPKFLAEQFLYTAADWGHHLRSLYKINAKSKRRRKILCTQH